MQLRIPVDTLHGFTRELLEACGCEASEAEIVTDNLIWNSCIARPTQGLWRLPYLLERLQQGLITSPCRPEYQARGPAIGLLDGGNGFGQYVGHLAMQKACELAREAGVGAVGVMRSNWNGSGACYVQAAASQGLIGLCTSNSVPKVAPFGGSLPVFGTNPLAFGAPRANGETILLDMATAEQSGSSRLLAAQQGQPDDEPLLPLGGAKGYGLALMVEILSGVLTGAGISQQVASLHDDFIRPGNNGHFFLALDICRLMPLDLFYERLEGLVELIRAAGGDSVPVLPGERCWRALAQSRQQGVMLDDATQMALAALAGAKGIRLPW